MENFYVLITDMGNYFIFRLYLISIVIRMSRYLFVVGYTALCVLHEVIYLLIAYHFT